MNSNFTPTESQRNIANVVLNGSGNVAVIAGPGSGKTTTIEWLIRTQLPKKAKSLYLTFTNALADPARLRMPKENTIVATMHSIGYALLAQEFTYGNIPDSKYNYPLYKILSNIADPKQKEFHTAKESLLTLFNFARYNLSDFSEESLIEIATENSLDYHPMAKAILPELWQTGIDLATEGQWFKGKKQRVWEFTDLIALPIEFGIRPKPDMKIGSQEKERHWPMGGIDYIFVDEFQDFNLAQLQLLRLIAGDSKIIIIGDPMQSIYNFAGAFPGMMEHGVDQLNAEVCTLYDNWRNPQSVVEMLNAKFGTELIPNNPNGDIVRGNWREWLNRLTPQTAILTRAMRGSKSEAFRFLATCLQNGIELNVAGLELKKISNHLIRMAKEATKAAGFELPWKRLPDELLTLVASAPKYKREELAEQVQMVIAFVDFSKAQTFDQYDKFLVEFEKFKKNRPILTTGHKSKGNEWEQTLVLGADLLPAYRKGMTERQKKQEYFLDFVMNSRAKDTLLLSNSPDGVTIVPEFDDSDESDGEE